MVAMSNPEPSRRSKSCIISSGLIAPSGAAMRLVAPPENSTQTSSSVFTCLAIFASACAAASERAPGSGWSPATNSDARMRRRQHARRDDHAARGSSLRLARKSTAAMAIGFAAFPIAMTEMRRWPISLRDAFEREVSAGPGATARTAAQYSWTSAIRESIGRPAGITAHWGWLGVFIDRKIAHDRAPRECDILFPSAS